MVQKLTKKADEVLEYFFRNPTREIHIRGLADETGIPYSSVRNALRNLEQRGLVDKREESKMTFYSANNDSKTFKREKRIHNLSSLYSSGLIEDLEKAYRPDSVVLFGSYLEGTDREGSDVDIAIINGREKSPDLSRHEEKLGRSIQVTNVEKVTEEDRSFRNTLANGYVLKGHLKVV